MSGLLQDHVLAARHTRAHLVWILSSSAKACRSGREGKASNATNNCAVRRGCGSGGGGGAGRHGQAGLCAAEAAKPVVGAGS